MVRSKPAPVDCINELKALLNMKIVQVRGCIRRAPNIEAIWLDFFDKPVTEDNICRNCVWAKKVCNMCMEVYPGPKIEEVD